MNIQEILSDKDLISVANKASNPFRHILSKDEIDNCITNAAWNLEKFYNPERSAKRSTYFYNGVRIEITKFLKSIRKDKNKTCLVTTSIESPSDQYEEVDIIDEIKNCDDPEIIFDRFYNRYTLKDMSKKYGITRQGIKLRIEKNLEIIRKRLK
jgi:1-aminocyclopropane-1-carboxylate deaminase/D-cysteine desulfhydrase-like pyridoxal-dependent ACC family enzyme